MKKRIIVTALLASTFLSACDAGNAQTDSRHSAMTERVDLSLTRMGSRNPIRAGGAQFSDRVNLGAVAERNSAALLPSHLQASGAISLVSRDPMSLNDIAQRLTEMTGIPHVLALGPTGQLTLPAESDPANASDLSASAGADTEAAATTPGAVAARVARGTSASERAGADMVMRPDLRGSLSEVLDQITNSFDVEWSYAEGRVLIRDYVTRKYQVSALPSSTNSSATIAANEISTASTTNSDIWAEIRETLGGIVGEGSAVSIGATTGLITVTAKVSDQNRVEEYIKQLNGSIGQQVTFDVNVLTVSLDGSTEAGLDLQAAFRGADWSGGINGEGDRTGSVNIGLIDGVYNINAVVKALSSQGRVAVSTRAGATTSNNRIAPIQVTESHPYISGYETESDVNTGAETVRPTVETVETGFQMQLFPRIMNNREIMVQYTVRLSELNDMRTFGTGTGQVQLPQVSTTSFEQQAVLENGQTLVLAGFERERVESKSGKSVTGKNVSNSHDRVATVLLITPRLVGRSAR